MILFSIRSRFFVRRTQHFNNRNEVTVHSIANLQEKVLLNIHADITTTDQKALLCRRFMNERMGFHFHDVVRNNLRRKRIANERDKRVVKVLPHIVLFQIRIHASKWRRHR